MGIYFLSSCNQSFWWQLKLQNQSFDQLVSEFCHKNHNFQNFSISAHWQMYQCIVLCQFLWDGKRWVSCTQYNILNDRIGDVLTNDRCLQESPPSHDYHHWFVSCQMSVLIHACPNLLCTSSKQLWCCTLQCFKIYFRNYKFKKSWSMR